MNKKNKDIAELIVLLLVNGLFCWSIYRMLIWAASII